MRDTVIPQDNPYGHAGEDQSMQFPAHLDDNHPDKKYEGLPKGIAVILEERGFIRRVSARVNHNRAGEKITATCKQCEIDKSRKMAALRANEGLAADENDNEDSGNDSDTEFDRDECCLTRMLSRQADFKAQKSMLEQVITEAGHVCLFLPKFHCELNPIEYYWGWVKREYRDRCDGRYTKSQKLLTEVLDKCPGTVIRRFIRRSFRYASVYRLGATGPLADYAVKKYRSHRAVSERELVVAEEEKRAKDATLERFGPR